MSSDRLTTQRKQHHTAAADLNEEATVLLSHWLPVVAALPQLIDAKQHETAVRELVAWYERVFLLDDYRADPPIQGLDALVDELAHVSVPADDHAELAKGRWAVRVAEELVSWRRCLRASGPGPVPAGPAADLLKQAIAGARRQITDSWTATQ